MRILTILLLLLTTEISGQNIFRGKVLDQKNGTPVIGAIVSIPALQKGCAADTGGFFLINDIPDGKFNVTASLGGYNELFFDVTFPSADTLIVITLQENTEELETVIVSSTRTNSRIDDTPVKLEVIGQDEIEEMTGINPSSVSMLLTEASGVQPQLTSATTGNINARIYGLDGGYTQIVRDGFPMYNGFSSGLSIMQIPPLDLKQIEIIKGASSTLYGGDAIAGVMNLVTRTPDTKPEGSILLNQTQRAGSDMDVFCSARNRRLGFSLFLAGDLQKPEDVDHDGFTDIPSVHSYGISPKIYWYINDSTTLSLLLNSSLDQRNGGDIRAIENGIDSVHSYINGNISKRNYTQLRFDTRLRNHCTFTVKNSLSYYQRDLSAGPYSFSGDQFASYSEISILKEMKQHAFVAGGNFLTDRFMQQHASGSVMNYDHFTAGVFLQDDWKLGKRVIYQPGLRFDAHNHYGNFILPRSAVIFKFSSSLVGRLCAGYGYKIPNAFTTGTDEYAYHNVLPLSNGLRAETSIGVNGDLNFKRVLGDVSMNINQAFFYVHIAHPVIAQSDSLAQGITYFINAQQPIVTSGLETNMRLSYRGIVFHCGYTYTKAVQEFVTGNREAPFVCKHHVLLDMIGDIGEGWSLGLEGFYYGPQYLGNDHHGVDYWECAFMLAKDIRKVRILLNVENIFDERQTRHGAVVLSAYGVPEFAPIYMPLNGRIINLSMRVKI